MSERIYCNLLSSVYLPHSHLSQTTITKCLYYCDSYRQPRIKHEDARRYLVSITTASPVLALRLSHLC